MSITFTPDQCDLILSELIRYFFKTLSTKIYDIFWQFIKYTLYIYLYRVTKPGGYIEVTDNGYKSHVEKGPTYRKILDARKHIHLLLILIIL
jgi:hypothetical protein